MLDEIKSAGTGIGVVVFRISLNLHVGSAEIFSHERDVRFRDRKVGIDRVQTLDGQERRSAGADDVPDVDIAQSGAAIDGRFDEAMVEIDLRSRDCGIRFLRVGLRGIQVLTGGHMFLAQLFLSFQVRLVQRRIGLGRSERGLVRAGIDREKEVAFFQIGAVFEMALRDLTADLRLDLDRLVRARGSDFIQIKGHIFLDDFGGRDHARRHFLLLRLVPAAAQPEHEHDEEKRAADEVPAFPAHAAAASRFRLRRGNVGSGHGRHGQSVQFLEATGWRPFRARSCSSAFERIWLSTRTQISKSLSRTSSISSFRKA